MSSRSFTPRLVVAIVIFVLLLVVLVRTAWVCDEAYLTFRTVDNWVHGYGLRWNPVERVQAYSHPLWLLLVATGYAVTGDSYYTVLALSGSLTLAAVLVLALRLARSPGTAVGAGALLLLSKAFVDFSTSGLEQPLTYLLLALFFSAYFGSNDRARTTRMAWLAGLLAVTRADALVLVAPALALAVWQDRHEGPRRRLLAAALPLLAWEVFATIYYGFPLPNAVYAWATPMPSLPTLLGRSAVYLLDSVNVDPITMAALAATVALSATEALAEARPLAAGIGLSVVVVMGTGGNPMSGRLLAAPLFCAAIAASRIDLSATTVLQRVHVLALIVLLGLMAPGQTVADRQSAVPIENERTGIADARLVTSPATGLLNVLRGGLRPNAMAERGGRAAREVQRIVVPSGGNLVPAAFFAGPSVHIIDLTGDADPVLARRPPAERQRPGPALRDLPDGYEDTVVSGVNRISAPELAAYYDRLAVVTRGPLWSARRWRTIFTMNLTFEGAPAGRPTP